MNNILTLNEVIKLKFDECYIAVEGTIAFRVTKAALKETAFLNGGRKFEVTTMLIQDKVIVQLTRVYKNIGPYWED